MNGLFRDNIKNLSGLTQIQANYIETDVLVVNQTDITTALSDINQYETVNDSNITNIQNQLSNISSIITNGGGFLL